MAISGDGVDSHLSFCDEEGYQFSLLADTDNAVRTACGALNPESGTPGRVTYVLDEAGRVLGCCSSTSDMQLHAQRALEILEAQAAP